MKGGLFGSPKIVVLPPVRGGSREGLSLRDFRSREGLLGVLPPSHERGPVNPRGGAEGSGCI